jgi:hypothetical protein
MPSPYRSTVAYRGESFVSMGGTGRTKIKGTLHFEGVGLTPEEKEALIETFYSWRKSDAKDAEEKSSD